MKLLSDLHSEFWPLGYIPDYLTQPTDILILAGDIAVGKLEVEKLLATIAPFHNHIIYLPGNHEYYGYDIHCLDNLKLPSNVHYLNPGFVRVDDVTFIGATLWTDFRNSKKSEKVAGKYITDFKRIKGFTTQHAKELYNYHHDYIQKAVGDIPGKKVIITHFLPGEHCVNPKYLNQGYPTHELNGYFAPIPSINTTEVAYWLFGHTHDSVGIRLGNTTYVANPYGYQGHEINKSFKTNLTLN